MISILDVEPNSWLHSWTKEFSKKFPYRSCRPGVRQRVVFDAGNLRSSLVRKAVHCTAVDNKLIVGSRVIHFVNERCDVRHRNVRVECAVANEYFRLNCAGLRWLRCGQASMDTNYACEVQAAPC